MFGDRSSGKFGAYWVDGGKACITLTLRLSLHQIVSGQASSQLSKLL